MAGSDYLWWMSYRKTNSRHKPAIGRTMGINKIWLKSFQRFPQRPEGMKITVKNWNPANWDPKVGSALGNLRFGRR
jgi:hypothetical protein